MATTKTELINTANGNAILATNTAAPFDSFSWDSTGTTGSVSLAVRWYVDNVLVETSDAVSITVNAASGLTEVSNYPMTETSGNMIDTVNAHNGTLNGGVSRDGTKYTFDGVDGYVDITDNDDHSFVEASADVPFEIEFKINANSYSNTQYIISKRENSASIDKAEWMIVVSAGNGSLMLRLFEGGVDNAGFIERGIPVTQLTAGLEQTIKFAYDGSGNRAGITATIDEANPSSYHEGTASTYNGMANTTTPTYVGCLMGVAPQTFFTGTLRDIKIRKG